MKTGLITGARQFRFHDVSERQLKQGGAIVDITLCGICGSDVSAWRSGAHYPAGLCGHEWTGIVSAIAMEIPGIVEGTRVICSGPGPCVTGCSACLQGHYHACANVVASLLGADGFSPDSGGFAPRQLVDARRLLPVPPGLSDIQAAMVEPATVATRAIRRSTVIAGDRVAVLGCGPIGLFAIQSLLAAGAGTVIAIDPSSHRRGLAKTLGAHLVFAPDDAARNGIAQLTDNLGLDLVVDCAGVPATVQFSADLARQRGTVMLVGVATQQVPIDPAVWVLKELTLLTSVGFDKADSLAVLGLMESGQIRVDSMYSETIDLGQTGVAIEELAAGSDKVKVLVNTRT